MTLSTWLAPILTAPSPPPFTLLFFASSWCPDCTPVVPALSSFFNSINATTKTVAGVYISSDRTPEAIKQHASLLPPEFFTVDSAEHRAALKTHFGACAGSEVGGLAGIKRRFGIPTIIVLKTDTLEVVSENGVADIKQGASIIEKWAV